MMLDFDETFYIDSLKAGAGELLGFGLAALLRCYPEKPVFLCIGTEKVTGDALGPLVGTHLSENGLTVFGTLSHPVHALNLSDTIADIYRAFPKNPVVAIDASLGIREHLGFLTLGRGSLAPGAGVHKLLNSVGDLFLTGIVAPAGPFSQYSLQNVPLSTVFALAKVISDGILKALDMQTAADLSR